MNNIELNTVLPKTARTTTLQHWGLTVALSFGAPATAVAADDLDALLGATPAPAVESAGVAPEAQAQDVKPVAVEPAAQPPTPPVNDTGLPVTAATTNTDAKRAVIKNRVIEEIVVTAQKREESLQDVPISIQAFSGDSLAARGIATTQQLAITVPSATFTTVAGFSLIFIRGIGTDNFIPSADPSVATYVDGVYVPAGHETAQSLGSVQRVEILKGPQGTLFGRNSTGGAISIVTKEPGNEVESNAEGEYGKFHDEQFKFNLSGPITSWLSAGVSTLVNHKDSYYSDLYYMPQPDSLSAIRIKLNFHPIDNLSLGLTAFRTKQGSVAGVLGNNTTPSLLGKALLIRPAPDNYHSEIDLPQESKANQNIYYGNLSYQAPWFDVKYIGAYERITTEFASVDFDGSSVPLAEFDAVNEGTYLRTHELQFVSNQNTPFAEHFKWIAGLYYLNSQAGFPSAHLHLAPNALGGIEDQLGFPLPIIDTIVARIPALRSLLQDDGVTVRFTGLLKTQSYSAFSQATLAPTDWLDLTLGFRVQKEKRSIVESNVGALNPLTGEEPTVLLFGTPHHTAANLSQKAVIGVKPAEGQLVYLSYSVGFKSGTYNVVNIYTPPNYLVPEKVDTYELGSKLSFLDGSLRVNGAAFLNTIHNLQSGFVSLLSGGAVQFFTVPEAETHGVEFDTTWVPLTDLNPGLAITANAAYVRAKYTTFPKGPGFAPGTGIYSNNLNFTGNDIVRSPNFSGDVGLVQALDLGSDGTLELAVDEYYNAGFFYDSENAVREGAYAVLNAHASYEYKPWKTRVTVFGSNLLSRRYHFQQFQTDFGIKQTLAAPVEFGLRLGWEF